MTTPAQPPPSKWQPIPLSQLKSSMAGLDWIWEGMLARKRITLMSAQAKAGKTTLLAILFRELARGGAMMGAKVNPARVIIVTEEPADEWCIRRDRLELGDHVECVCLPFMSKPKPQEWLEMLREAFKDIQQRQIDLVIFDTLSHLWPVTQENDNSQQQEALMPLRHISEAGAAVLLVHHAGAAGERARGATELEGFVDQVTHFEKVAIGELDSRKRIIHSRGRLTGSPAKMTVELNGDATTYQVISGNIRPIRSETWIILESVVPHEPPGASITELRGRWPDAAETIPSVGSLSVTVDRYWEKAGWTKTDSKPARYWRKLKDWQPSLTDIPD